ncbi:hypothetical protein DL770_005841 [Monosporascus sp. CRB-9-2]|nr:hypothetical protein DL770_005841 [Monosporascus sp. CRB-9-2]
MASVGFFGSPLLRRPEALVLRAFDDRRNEVLQSGGVSPRAGSTPNSGDSPASLQLALYSSYVLSRLLRH